MLTRSVDVGVTQDGVIESRVGRREKQVMLYGMFTNSVGRDGGYGMRFIDGEVGWFSVDGATA